MSINVWKVTLWLCIFIRKCLCFKCTVMFTRSTHFTLLNKNIKIIKQLLPLATFSWYFLFNTKIRRDFLHSLLRSLLVVFVALSDTPTLCDSTHPSRAPPDPPQESFHDNVKWRLSVCVCSIMHLTSFLLNLFAWFLWLCKGTHLKIFPTEYLAHSQCTTANERQMVAKWRLLPSESEGLGGPETQEGQLV